MVAKVLIEMAIEIVVDNSIPTTKDGDVLVLQTVEKTLHAEHIKLVDTFALNISNLEVDLVSVANFEIVDHDYSNIMYFVDFVDKVLAD